jgi:iron donor protein CyaY
VKENEYRAQIQKFLDRIEAALADVDPDLVECEQAMGAMTLLFSGRFKCILSAQPSRSQLWVAMAAKGTAYHFDFNEVSQNWVDDKGKGIEAVELIEGFLKEYTKLDIRI